MPDATGLELLAQDLGDAAIETVYFREQATIVVDPAQIRTVLMSRCARRATRSWRACTASTTTPTSRAWA